MGQRTELRLIAIIGLAFFGVGLLAWGNYTGSLQIFGDSGTGPSNNDSVVVRPQTTSPDTEVYREDFQTATAADSAKLTAHWDIDAGNVGLESGQTTGLVQSLQVSDLTGEEIQVTLSAESSLPLGSQVYFSISADGGVSWEPIFPGRVATFTNPAGDWRWRALLDRGGASTNPTLDDLSLTFTVLE